MANKKKKRKQQISSTSADEEREKKKPVMDTKIVSAGENSISHENETHKKNNDILETHILQFLRFQHKSRRNNPNSTTNTNNTAMINKNSNDPEVKNVSTSSSGKLFQSALSLSFLMNRGHGNGDHDDNDDKEGKYDADKTLFLSISFLSSFLIDDTESYNTTISKAHVASLMLPWTVQSLIAETKVKTKSKEEEGKSRPHYFTSVLWKTLALSLEILLLGTAHGYRNTRSKPSDDQTTSICDVAVLKIVHQMNQQSKESRKNITIQCKDILNNILTQGTINKLVPLAIHSIQSATHDYTKEDDNSETIVIFATRCYCLLVLSILYRPTMDDMCHSLIPLIDDLISSLGINRCNVDINQHEQKPEVPSQSAIRKNISIASMSFATLKKLEKLQLSDRAINPKKTFILLSSIGMLTSLSNLSQISLKMNELQILSDLESKLLNSTEENFVNATVVKSILWHGLFDPEYHIDGFLSMGLQVPAISKSNHKSKSKMHSCYQQKLFESIEALFHVSENDENKLNLAVTRMDMVPLLIDGFMHQSNQFQDIMKQKSTLGKNKSSGTDKLSQTQFRFWCRSFNPLILLLDRFKQIKTHKVELKVLLQSIVKCLVLLSKSDAYLPSYVDPNNEHLDYLTSIGEIILHSMEQKQKMHQLQNDNNQSFDALKTLFGLNHHIFHKKLPRIIFAMAKSSSLQEEEIEHSSKLLSCICATYEKLRQLTHFLQAMLGCFDVQILDENFYSLNCCEERINHNAFSFLLHNRSFTRSFFVSIHTLPSGQIREIWSLFDKYFSLIGKEKEREIETATNIFVIFLKAVRVTPFNAKDLIKSCESSMKTFVRSLIQVTNTDINDSSARLDIDCKVSNTGLYLCGWLLSVHTKCCFWLNEIPIEIGGATDEFGHCGLPLVTLLSNTVRSLLASGLEKRHELGAIQHLTTHRIEQLHSNIYLQEQQEGLNDSSTEQSEYRSSTMIAEAKLLVDFLICSAQTRDLRKHDCENSMHRSYYVAGWKIVAQSLSTWTPYSESKHVDHFLQWLFSTLTTDIELQMKQNSTDEFGFDRRILSSLHDEEKAAAVALLNDASFFELHEIHQRWAAVGSLFTTQLAKKLVPKSIEKDIFDEELNNVISNNRNYFEDFVSESKKENSQVSNISLLEQIFRVMKILHQLCDHFFSDINTPVICNTILRIHALINSLVELHSASDSNSNAELRSTINIICECRSTLAKALSFDASTVSILGNLPFRDLIVHLNKVFNEKLYDKLDEQYKKQILSATTKLFRGMLISSLKSGNDCHLRLISLFDELSTSSLNLKTQMQLFRSLLQELINSTPAVLKPEDSETQNTLYQVSKLSVALLQRNFKYFKERESRQILDDNDAEFILYTADVLNLQSFCALEHRHSMSIQTDEVVKILYLVCKRVITDDYVPNSSRNRRLISSAEYFICCTSSPSLKSQNSLKKFNITNDLQTLIIHSVTNHQTLSPLIDAAYSEQLSCCTPKEIGVLVEDLLHRLKMSTFDQDMVPAILYCFDIMMRVVKENEHRQVLAVNATVFLQLMISSVGPARTSETSLVWSSRINKALSCLVTLIHKNDILILKGTHIAIILAAINAMYLDTHENNSFRHESVYLSSCELVKAMLRQYTGHVYGCVPLFTSVMRCLFNCLVTFGSGTSKKETGGTKQMIKEFTKICESLPDHKDVFKKHIVFLIFDYIDVLVSGTLLLRKKVDLEQAFLFVLETLSVYEIQQLTSMVVSTGKPFLQSLIKNFHKHQYKGQF